MNHIGSFILLLFMMKSLSFGTQAYTPPSWCPLRPPSHGRLSLAHLPTPLYPLNSYNNINMNHNALLQPLTQHNITVWVKRDDMTGGIELGGNKIRKLEFLMADALANHCTGVLTIGGTQSNHCRATAAVARQLGLQPHLILRSSTRTTTSTTTTSSSSIQQDNDIGTIGNLLIDRMVGSTIYTCTPGEYGRMGSHALVQRVADVLEHTTQQKIYRIPVGGSNAIGTWGYIQAVEEVIQQIGSSSSSTFPIDHVVFACGSGGTALGIVLGFALAFEYGALQNMPKLHAVGVCDDPDYFYSTMTQIAIEMGLTMDQINRDNNNKYTSVEDYLRQHVTLHQGKGLGYATNTPEELSFIVDFARATGITLDPVYSGKALYHFWTHVLHDTIEQFANQNILFWHTGGALGLFDKCNDLETSTSLLQESPCQKLDIYGKGNGLDISE